MKSPIVRSLVPAIAASAMVLIWVVQQKLTAHGLGGANGTPTLSANERAYQGATQAQSSIATERKGVKLDIGASRVMIGSRADNSQATRLHKSVVVQNSIAEIFEKWPRGLDALDGAGFDEAVNFLRDNGRVSDFAWLAAKLRDPLLSLEVRMAYAYVLEKVATPEAARVLLDYLAWPDADADMVDCASRGVSEIAYTLIDGRRNFNVSPVLEDAWSKTSPDAPQMILDGVATSIAYLGTHDGVQKLIETVLELPDGAFDEKAHAALRALSNISSPDAVSILASTLGERLPDNLFHAIVIGLFNVGNADAYWALIPALQSIPAISDEDYELLKYLVTVKHDVIKPESLKVVRYLNEVSSFADVRVGGLFSGEPTVSAR